MSEEVKRPQQVTMAAIAAGSASLVMLISIGDRLSRWRTVDLREAFAKTLAQDDLGGRLGLSLDQAMALARIGLLVTGGVAAAMTVLAVFAVRRDRGARLAMSVLAVPMLVLGVIVDPFLAGFVVIGTVLLWRQPARDWFAGREPRARPEPEPPAQTSAPGPTGPPAPSVDTVWPPVRPPEASYPPPTGPPSPGPAPYTGGYGVAARRPLGFDGSRRPPQVLTACVITWAVSLLVAVFCVLGLVGTIAPGPRADVRRQLADRMREMSSSGTNTSMVSVDGLLVAAQVLIVVILLWALAAAWLAVLALRGRSWARVTLVASAAVAGVLGLVGLLGALVLLVVTVACVWVIAGLLSPASSRWYAARKR